MVVPQPCPSKICTNQRKYKGTHTAPLGKMMIPLFKLPVGCCLERLLLELPWKGLAQSSPEKLPRSEKKSLPRIDLKPPWESREKKWHREGPRSSKHQGEGLRTTDGRMERGRGRVESEGMAPLGEEVRKRQEGRGDSWDHEDTGCAGHRLTCQFPSALPPLLPTGKDSWARTLDTKNRNLVRRRTRRNNCNPPHPCVLQICY